MSSKDPAIFLEHILECIDLIQTYLGAVTKKEFMSDAKLQDAVIRRLEIIGEAVKNLPDDYKKKHKRVPWREISGMRDVLIHEYFGVDLDLTWKTASSDLSKLKVQLVELKAELK